MNLIPFRTVIETFLKEDFDKNDFILFFALCDLMDRKQEVHVLQTHLNRVCKLESYQVKKSIANLIKNGIIARNRDKRGSFYTVLPKISSLSYTNKKVFKPQPSPAELWEKRKKREARDLKYFFAKQKAAEERAWIQHNLDQLKTPEMQANLRRVRRDMGYPDGLIPKDYLANR